MYSQSCIYLNIKKKKKQTNKLDDEFLPFEFGARIAAEVNDGHVPEERKVDHLARHALHAHLHTNGHRQLGIRLPSRRFACIDFRVVVAICDIYSLIYKKHQKPLWFTLYVVQTAVAEQICPQARARLDIVRIELATVGYVTVGLLYQST